MVARLGELPSDSKPGGTKKILPRSSLLCFIRVSQSNAPQLQLCRAEHRSSVEAKEALITAQTETLEVIQKSGLHHACRLLITSPPPTTTTLVRQAL
eukprot:4136820-Amphidinium_carterae.2